LAKVKKKMATQMLAFSKLAASAWGTSVPRARQVYAVVIRSVLAYKAPSWHKIGGGLKDLSKALTPTQNKCLQIMSGAYKATPTRYLESEMAMPPLDLYFDKWVADFESRIAVSGMAQLLRQMGARAAQMAAGSRRRGRRGQIRQLLRDSRARAAANWVGGNKDTENTMLRKWRNRWKTAVATSGRGVLAAHKKPDLANHKIYKNLYKHEASVFMQARTDCVGMAEFLFRRHVPNVLIPLCSCGRASETPEHMLLYCQKTRE
jgi:hypothetical protein